ncbi:MAG TPA: sigma-54 dependent transcriptional regulator [Pirellulales bacterium]|nr:sigma-54 dependent transcriptional regulator [Pirellulales bacterium]
MSKILIVDDEANVLVAFEKMLSVAGHTVLLSRSGERSLELVGREHPDAVVLDVRMPGMNGLDALSAIRNEHPRLPIIVMTGQGTMETAIEATKRGAFDYLLKPFDPAAMLQLIERAVQDSRVMDRQVALDPQQAAPGVDAIVGRSPAMQEVFKMIGRVAPTDATVLIRGESGTGKELVARAIYQHSRRAAEPLYVVNCVAIPETLLEAELFGHERGAFTGAHARRIGKLEQADRGTVFLDEIGDIPPGIQAKLLRVLQERTLERIGGNETINVDVRIVAATNRNLERAMAEGEFREDLYHRLNVVTVRLPPLRERRGDVRPLVNFFLDCVARELGVPSPAVAPDAWELLENYAWPGNVRELENCIERLVIVTRGHTLQCDNVRQALSSGADAQAAETLEDALGRLVERFFATLSGPQPYEHFLRALDRRLLSEALARAQGNLARAARLLGIPRATLHDKAQKHGLRTAERCDGEPS